MYEAVKHTNFNAFLVVSLWDGEDPVVQCGECLAVYGEEDAKILRGVAPSAPVRMGFARAKPAERTAPPKRPAIDESAIDAELAAMKKRLGK